MGWTHHGPRGRYPGVGQNQKPCRVLPSMYITRLSFQKLFGKHLRPRANRSTFVCLSVILPLLGSLLSISLAPSKGRSPAARTFSLSFSKNPPHARPHSVATISPRLRFVFQISCSYKRCIVARYVAIKKPRTFNPSPSYFLDRTF